MTILATSVIILDVIVSTVLTTNVDLFKELERYLSRTSVTVFSGVAAVSYTHLTLPTKA